MVVLDSMDVSDMALTKRRLVVLVENQVLDVEPVVPAVLPVRQLRLDRAESHQDLGKESSPDCHRRLSVPQVVIVESEWSSVLVVFPVSYVVVR